MMTLNHVEELCGDIGPADLVTQSAIGVGWPAPRLSHFLAEETSRLDHGEWWVVPAASWRMVMYRADKTSSSVPCGCVVFTPSLMTTVPAGRIATFALQVHLVWTHPVLRRQGYGKHLAAHLVRYFAHYPAAGARRALLPNGIRASVTADSDSEGGRRVVRYVHEYFELQREMFMIEQPGKHRGWPICSTNFVDE